MFYILIFAISLLLIFFGLKTKNKIASRILVLIGLLIPCIIAGLRNTTVGTDTGGYITNLYKIAGKSINFNEFIKNADIIYNCKDMIYLFITYIFGHYNISFQLMLFLFESLTIFPIYFAIKKIKLNNNDIILGMTIFYLMLFNLSMNMVRQSIAIAFILLSFAIFIKRRRKKTILLSILLFIIAVEFHDSALYILPIYPLYYILNNKNIHTKIKNTILVITVVLALLFLLFYRPILTFIGNSGIYPKALWYLNKYNLFNIDYTGTFRNLFVAALVFYKREFFYKNRINYKFGILIVILNFILGFLGTFIVYADRLSLYLFYLITANYITLLTKKNNNSIVVVSVILIVFVTYWIITILINNSCQTLPYIMFFNS